MLRGAGGELIASREYVTEQFGCWNLAAPAARERKSRVSELLILGVLGFADAIGENLQQVAGLQSDSPL